MGYLSAERVKEIRTQLKAEFKGFKFSITRDGWSGIKISILEAPIKMTEDKYEQVNHYHITSHYDGQVKEILLRIVSVANFGVKYYETGDYGTQPTFYVSINIGEWDKPFKYTGIDMPVGLPAQNIPQPQSAN